MVKSLEPYQREELFARLKKRFEMNMERHQNLIWDAVEKRLLSSPLPENSDKENLHKLWSLNEMERTGGEPDVIMPVDNIGEIFFYDCAPESPEGRRSICYDHEALASRKKFKPDNSAVNMASEMGIEMLNEAQYKELQQFGPFDTKTSSWILTPPDIRDKGGALFCDHRFGHTFVYHNGAESYYAARAFRGLLRF